MKEIIKAVEKIAIEISELLKYGDFSYAQSSNSTGDTQLKLDILSDEIIENRLKKLSNIKAIISEEKESILSHSVLISSVTFNKSLLYLIASIVPFCGSDFSII